MPQKASETTADSFVESAFGFTEDELTVDEVYPAFRPPETTQDLSDSEPPKELPRGGPKKDECYHNCYHLHEKRRHMKTQTRFPTTAFSANQQPINPVPTFCLHF